VLPDPRSTDQPAGSTAQYTDHWTASAIAVKKSLVWELPEQAAAGGPPGVAVGVMFGDDVSLGGGLEASAVADALVLGSSLGDSAIVGLAEAGVEDSVCTAADGVTVAGVAQAALPTTKTKKTSGRRTSVTPGRARCTA
jgi:hypothetical protein